MEYFEPKITQILNIKYIAIRNNYMKSLLSPKSIEINSDMTRIYFNNCNDFDENCEILQSTGVRLAMEYLSERLEDYSRNESFFKDKYNNQYNENKHKVEISKENKEIVIIPQCKFVRLLYSKSNSFEETDKISKIYPNGNNIEYITFIREKLLLFFKDDGCFIFEFSDDFEIGFNVILERFILIFNLLRIEDLDLENIRVNYCTELKTLLFEFGV